jgi:hypothetical protein
MLCWKQKSFDHNLIQIDQINFQFLTKKFEPQPSSNQANQLPILDQPSFDGWTFRVVMSSRAHQCEYNNHCTKDPQLEAKPCIIYTTLNPQLLV